MPGGRGDLACGHSGATMKRPHVEDPGVNYHALEGGGWYPPACADEHKRPDRGTSVVTRVIIAVIAIALVCSAAASTPWSSSDDVKFNWCTFSCAAQCAMCLVGRGTC